MALKRRFQKLEYEESVNLHRKRALALEEQYGADLRDVIYELTVHFLQGEAWQKGNQAMTFAFKNAMLDFKAIRDAARIVDFVVANDFIPDEVRVHTLQLLRKCREETETMMRMAADKKEVSILEQVRGSERRDSKCFNTSVCERVERHLRLIEDHYVYTLEERYVSVDAGTMAHFLDLFVNALQRSTPESAFFPKNGEQKNGEQKGAPWHWPCGANAVTPVGVRMY